LFGFLAEDPLCPLGQDSKLQRLRAVVAHVGTTGDGDAAGAHLRVLTVGNSEAAGNIVAFCISDGHFRTDGAAGVEFPLCNSLYGTQYLKPTYALLDELAADFGHTEAGQKLKDARENSARMVRTGLAAVCDYVEANRKATAIAFVVDAFNGKVDSILTKTKKDNVYVISSVGSFGENVYKVGMTRRLEPLDRVKELGDASVPFPFDVHAIIETDDAPALETSLHRALSLMQMNKVNPRKEFFKVQLADIRALVEKAGLKANWTIEAAAEYRETLAIEEEMRNDPEARKKWEEFAAIRSCALAKSTCS